MPSWASHNLRTRDRRTSEEDALTHRIAAEAKRVQERREFLDHLARKHAKRLGISLTLARQHVDAVSVTGRPDPEKHNGL
jgi:hypothetical protein